MVEYFRTVDRLSDRVLVQDLGPTTEGRPYLLAIVSSPDTIADLPRYQAMQSDRQTPRPPRRRRRTGSRGRGSSSC